MKIYLSTILFGFVMNLAVAQQDARFIIEVSSDSIPLGHYFEVKFILENAHGSYFEPPTFEGFTVVGGPNQSSSFSMVNGKVSQNMSYSYYLQPQEIGNYFIQPASVKVGDEILETQPKKILVVVNPEADAMPQLKKKEKTPPAVEPTPKPKPSQKKRKVYRL